MPLVIYRLIQLVTDMIENNDFQLSTDMEHLLTGLIDNITPKRDWANAQRCFFMAYNYYAQLNSNKVCHTFYFSTNSSWLIRPLTSRKRPPVPLRIQRAPAFLGLRRVLIRTRLNEEKLGASVSVLQKIACFSFRIRSFSFKNRALK